MVDHWVIVAVVRNTCMFDMFVFLVILCASTKKFAFQYVSDIVVQILPRYDESDMCYMRRKDAQKQFPRTSLID